MRIWQLIASDHVGNMAGKAAALSGGRWNHRGVPAIYTCRSPALCALEAITTITTAVTEQPVMFLVEMIAPDDTELYWQPDRSKLPKDWEAIPQRQPAREFGSAFLKANDRLGLIVPSAIMPLEDKIVINPRHPAMKKITIVKTYEYRRGERMFN